MKIDKQKLIELLVEKTEMSGEEVENQLEQLIERILDAAKRGKALEIREFGLFYFDEKGELNFDAAKELSTEISFKYAGMKPVELKPAHSYELDEEEDEIEKESMEFDEEDADEAETDEPASEAEEEEVDPIDENPLEPVAELDEESDLDTEKEVKPPRSTPPVSPRRKKDNTGIWILAAIVLIAVMDTGQADENIAILEPDPADMANGEMADTPTESETESTIEGTGSQDLNQQPPANQTVSETEEEAEEETTETGTAPEDQPLYGLRGNMVEAANNGYSIVLHSFTDETNARQTADRLRNDNYRVIIVPRNVQDQTVWRVSVGQFSSLEEARSATNLLPPPYNQRNFIHRIQIN
ncbi:MAG: hypothetical protein GVY02_05360 [Bacteroidetes bacterium]|jgi:cell division septation protein DedD/nucleoid DNA-binding protein|nr:hypothetical protein [Bacteroidota bacterium]